MKPTTLDLISEMVNLTPGKTDGDMSNFLFLLITHQSQPTDAFSALPKVSKSSTNYCTMKFSKTLQISLKTTRGKYSNRMLHGTLNHEVIPPKCLMKKKKTHTHLKYRAVSRSLEIYHVL